jgi:hypothetical protein
MIFLLRGPVIVRLEKYTSCLRTRNTILFGMISQNNSPGDHTTVNNDVAHQARDDLRKV